MSETPPIRAVFRERHRLTHKREFDAVYAGKARKSPTIASAAGEQSGGGVPFTVFGVPNALGHSRLGLSVARRIGNAPQRNTFKRRIREAFRLSRASWDDAPGAVHLDLVVNALPHTPRTMRDYASMLTWCVDELTALHVKRASRPKRTPAGDGRSGDGT